MRQYEEHFFDNGISLKVDCTMNKRNGNIISISSDAVIDDGFMWLTSLNYNAILKICIDTGKCNEYYFFPETSKKEMCISMTKIDSDIYFAPYNASFLWRFDINNKTFRKIDVGLTENETKKDHKFSKIIKYGRFIYLFGQSIKRLIRFNIDSEEVEEIYEYHDVYDRCFADEWDAYIDDYYLDDGILLMPLKRELGLMKVDLDNINIEFVKFDIGKSTDRIVTISRRTDGIFFLSDNSGRVWKWETLENKITDLGCTKRIAKRVLPVGNERIYVIYAKYNQIGCINIDTHKIENIELSELRDNEYPEGIYWQFEFVKESNGYLFIQSRCIGTIVRINCNENEMKIIHVKMERRTYEEIMTKNMTEYEQLFLDSRFFDLNDLIIYLRKEEV